MKRAIFWQLSAVYAAGIVLMVCSYIVANNFVSLYPPRWRVNVKPMAAFTSGNPPLTDTMSKDCKSCNKLHSTVKPNMTNATSSCPPKHRIVFIKTHKTGSSTIATMIHRYGYNRNLNFALPESYHAFSEFLKFNESRVYGWDIRDKKKSLVMPALGGFHIFSCHGRYNRAAMDAVIPDAIYFTILREPPAQLESAFDFYGVRRYLPHHDFTDIFKIDPESILKSKNPTAMSFMRNGQMFDLGLEQEFQDPKSVDDKIKSLSKEIDLVMIMEYFDESLILLKKLLCWDFDDIVYMSKLVRPSKVRKNITTDLKNKIEKWNHADMKLYQHFNKTFWDKVQKFGWGFQRELQTFREIKMATTTQCLKDVTVKIDNHKTSTYKISSNSDRKCQDLVRSERKWVDILRQDMKKKFTHLIETSEK